MGLAVANVKMAPRHGQGIAPHFLVQMDSNHVDTSPGKVQVKFEPFDQLTRLLLFHLDMETKSGIGSKLDFFAHQFLESSCVGVEPGRVICPPQLAAVCLLRQTMTELTPKRPRMVEDHLRET